MTISKDRVKPSPSPDSWKLKEIFAQGVCLGAYMALMTVIFYYLMVDTDFFSDAFGVRSLRPVDGNEPLSTRRYKERASVIYLQVRWGTNLEDRTLAGLQLLMA
jgi:hypothetical protein